MIVRAWSVACRVVGAVSVILLAAVTFTSLPNMVARRIAVPPAIEPAEAIVVLGASAHEDGTLNDASLRRAIAGIRLYHRGLAPTLVFLGMNGEAESRARLARELGVPADAILAEGLEPTTRDEADRMGVVLAQRRGVRRVLLVTDVLHMRRARLLFERFGLSVVPASTDTGILGSNRPENRLALTRAVGQELAALAYHKLFRYL